MIAGFAMAIDATASGLSNLRKFLAGSIYKNDGSILKKIM
jgi:hypothetical protein